MLIIINVGQLAMDNEIGGSVGQLSSLLQPNRTLRNVA